MVKVIREIEFTFTVFSDADPTLGEDKPSARTVYATASDGVDSYFIDRPAALQIIGLIKKSGRRKGAIE